MSMDLRKSFWAGNIGAVVERGEALFANLNLKESVPSDLAVLVGAYVFSGSFNQARILAEDLFSKLDPEGQAEVSFYLIVGWVRKSEYARAFREIQKFKPRAKRHDQSEGQGPVQFYYQQSVAFYTYYRSEFKTSAKWAEKSLKTALQLRHPFFELLGRDMLGGVFVQVGQISLGVEQIDRALKVAQKLGNGGFANALEVSSVNFKAQYGLLDDPIQSLRNAIAELKNEDDYSSSELKLELARQYQLRAQLAPAEALLNECSREIYKAQNKRQSSTLHLRLATLMFARGQREQALSLLHLSEMSLNPKHDQVFIARLQGLKVRLTQELELGSAAQTAVLKSDWLSQRMDARRDAKSFPVPRGEDPLGDLVDQVLSGPAEESLKLIVRHDLWHFLPEVLLLQRSKNYLIFGVEKSSLTLFSHGEVMHLNQGLTPLHRLVLFHLFTGPQTKEDLIEKVWNYTYDPLRHDQLIYVAISGLRKLLGRFSHWIEASENSYSIAPDVEPLNLDQRLTRAKEAGREKVLELEIRPGRSALIPGLNSRQNDWLQGHSGRDFHFSIKDYQRQFKISHMTAYRDLAEMVEKKFLLVTGHARATRYHLNATFMEKP